MQLNFKLIGNRLLMRKRLIKILFQLSFLVTSLIGIFVLLVWVGFFGSIPTKHNLKNIQNNLATEIYSADGMMLGKYYLQERSKVGIDDIPESVKQALIATEDARFYDHNGIDLRSLMRVIVKTVLMQNSRSGGGSTLSQQLSRNVFPRERHGKLTIPVNKVKELIMAYRLEQVYNKDQILSLYLNTVPFGDNVYGIGMASRRFYNKDISKLTIEEGAVLIGMLKSNYYYNPRLFPENAQRRRNVVLGQMLKYGYIDEGKYEHTKAIDLVINYKRESSRSGLATYFREQIKKEVAEWCKHHKKSDGSHYNLYTDGLKIHTTLDSRLQKYAEKAMREHMSELQKVFDNHWRSTKPWSDKPNLLKTAIENSARYKRMKKDGMSKGDIMKEMNKKHLMQLFSWSGDIEKEMSPVDSIKYYLNILQTGMLAMEPNTGDVKIWVGGINNKFFQFDHVNRNTKRQVGSTFKPFVYAAALESGLDPCEYISGAKVSYTNLANWAPDNADKEENKLKYSYKGALAKSVNTVTIKLLEEVGISKTILLAKNAGITSKLPEVPSVALGTASISLFEMVAAYCSFANGGMAVTPRMITSIEDSEGNLIDEFAHSTSENKVLTEQSANVMNHLLTSVIDDGTGSRLRWKYGLTNQLAGKTGTTQSNADGWFIGYNSKLVVGTWVGADNPAVRFRTTRLGSGSNTALPIFGKLFQQINKDPEFKAIARAKFKDLDKGSKLLVACELYKEDKNLFERILKIERKKEKVKNKDFGEAEEKGLFKKIGNLFKKKKKKSNRDQ